MVVGAGVSGMRAAISLAKLGNEVLLIEKDHFVGGRVAQSGELFMSGEHSKDVIKKLYDELKNEKNVSLFTGATIEKVTGSLGNFTIDISLKPRYVNWKKDGCDINQAMAECPIAIPDTFNFGLTKRKALYKNYPEALPDIPVADADALKNEVDYLEKFSNCIDLNQKVEHLTLATSTVLVTTGYDSYIPKNDEYGYKTLDNVITLPEYKRLLELSNGSITYNNKKIKSVAYIYCVGNRQTKGENKHCSRYCCTAAIHSSLITHKKDPGVKAYHLFRDIRTYGKQELLYDESSRNGDVYIRFEEKEPPQFLTSGNSTIIKVKDYLTSKMELEIEADLVVLVTGMVSREDSVDIADKFKIPIGNDKFFNEIHPKLKPVETVIKGVFIGGACQGPRNITESVQSSMAAAAKINSLIRTGSISLDPIIARIDIDKCTWCGKCADACEYNSLKKSESQGKEIAVVNKATCAGCGICAPVCPVDAIEIVQYTNNEIEGMINGFASAVEIMAKADDENLDSGGEELSMKEYPLLWKEIIKVIDGHGKSIPEISSETGIDKEIVMYHLMTMHRYNVVQTKGMDESEEYYSYTLKK
jgi:heterodisulfide reductase subunit A